jgi:RND family efflux transporter MFP subunit
MNKITTSVLTVLVLLFFASCKEKEAPKKEVIRPVKTMKVSYFINEEGKGFPAITKAYKETDLAFRVGDAPLIINNVVEGKKVNKGELVAAIDPTNFKIAVQSAKARYNQAKAEAERYERLWKKGSVSKSDYERKYAMYKEAESAYELAKNNLSYTKLYAPFTGYYGPKLADIGDVIKANQPITKLYDLSKIEVVTTIPEQLAVNFRYFDKYQVIFDTYPDTVFSATLKEMEKTPTPEGFKLHLYLDYKTTAKSSKKISAGMSCRVNILLKEKEGISNQEIIVPTAAVFEGETDTVPSVWIVTKDLTVKKQHVALDGFAGRDYIRIKSGLKPGQIIVVAGAKRLVEGQKVTILNQKNFN